MTTQYTADEQAMIDMGQRLIKDYDLDFGNAECGIQGEERRELYISVEAPNNATIGTIVPVGSSERELRRELSDLMSDFDADDRFDELWSPGFVDHNEFSPSQFLGMLQEDQEFFARRAEWIMHPEWGKPPEYGSRDDVICEIRWVDDDLRSWLQDHDYPVTEKNMDSMRDMVSGRELRDRSIERGWEAIESMIDDSQLDHDDAPADADDPSMAYDPADPSVMLDGEASHAPATR